MMGTKLKIRHELDVRVISLYSRSAKGNSAIEDLKFSGENYRSFVYFEFINVNPVTLRADDHDSGELHASPLFCAYKSTEKNENIEKYPFRRNFLVFCDINQYSAEGVKKFWESKQPITFFTTINLTDPQHARDVERILQKLLPKGSYICYHSFETFDIMLIYKGSDFNKYYKCIFELNYVYSKEIGLIDSFTFFGLDQSADFTDNGEPFGCEITFSVNNMQEVLNIQKSIQNEGIMINGFWTLGRRDYCFLIEDITLTQLLKVLEYFGNNIKKSNNILAIDNMKMILLSKPDVEVKGCTVDRKIDNKLTLWAKNLCEKYEEAYAVICDHLCVEKDEVFLKWVKDSCELSCQLYSNSLSHIVAQCLLPHYVDFFTYFIRLGDRIKKLNKKIWSVKNADDFRKGNNRFYTAVLSLIDSIDQSNRQLIYGPSFHSISIDMPPKLIAFYKAISHKLIRVLKDKEDCKNFYGIIFAPSFVPDLTVTPLIDHIQHHIDMCDKELSRDQLLVIDIGESSIYDMTRTVAVLTHEISHYVGNCTRCRIKRTAAMVKYTIHQALEVLILDFIKKDYIKVEMSEDMFGEMCVLVENLYMKMIKITNDQECDDRSSIYDGDLYMDDVVKCGMLKVFEDITQDRDLRQLIVEYLFKAYTKQNENITDREYSKLYQWRKNTIGLNASCDLERSLLIQKIDSDIQYWAMTYFDLQIMPIEQSVKEECRDWTYIDAVKSLYSETFADLQTILLLDLSFIEYADLLLRDVSYLSDILMRMAVISVVLKNKKHDGWKDYSIKNLTHIPESDQGRIVICVLNIIMNAESYDCIFLQQNKIDPAMFKYLEEYLSACYDEIKMYFRRKKDVKDLQKTYCAIKNNCSINVLESKMLDTIEIEEKKYTK